MLTSYGHPQNVEYTKLSFFSIKSIVSHFSKKLGKSFRTAHNKCTVYKKILYNLDVYCVLVKMKQCLSFKFFMNVSVSGFNVLTECPNNSVQEIMFLSASFCLS